MCTVFLEVQGADVSGQTAQKAVGFGDGDGVSGDAKCRQLLMTNTMTLSSPRDEKIAPQSPAEFRRTADYLCDQMRISAKALQLEIPPSDICRRLRVALENARDGVSLDALREVVCEFTALLRDNGSSPESVLRSLKAVINIHALPPVGFDDGIRSGYRLLEKITRWAIEEYFDHDARMHA